MGFTICDTDNRLNDKQSWSQKDIEVIYSIAKRLLPMNLNYELPYNEGFHKLLVKNMTLSSMKETRVAHDRQHQSMNIFTARVTYSFITSVM